ncbi:RLA class II histocompatibility antigen, DP alpha-1 chain-like, partial [Corapipo altera]|uniref:RLA class II histocompatibility antigen, DP alpha-1 chain-like n=1 Tax=Corapipo altera TaxID=415028 RepID=UPI000FD66174
APGDGAVPEEPHGAGGSQYPDPNILIPFPFPPFPFPVPPETALFPKNAVELEDPNVLICYITKFWPPVASITWFRNGNVVSEGVLETVFYPGPDNTFRKFSYLPFIPRRGEYYDCRVEHEGLREPRKTHWGEEFPLGMG